MRDGEPEPEDPVLTIESVSAINGTVTVTISASEDVERNRFTIYQSINDEQATVVVPTASPGSNDVYTFTIPEVAQTNVDQSVVISVALDDAEAVEAEPFIVEALEEEPVKTIADVKNLAELKTALADTNIVTINVTESFETAEKIVVSRAVTINGGNKEIKFTGDVAGWQGNFVMQVYNTTGVTLKDIKLTGGDGALLVNASEVVLEGTVDVSGNEFGGIEVSKGAAVGLENAKLTVTGATLVNTTEAYGLPTVWIDKAGGAVEGGVFTTNATVKDDQVQYYLDAANAVAPVLPVVGPVLSAKKVIVAGNDMAHYTVTVNGIDDATHYTLDLVVEGEQLTSKKAAIGTTLLDELVTELTIKLYNSDGQLIGTPYVDVPVVLIP